MGGGMWHLIQELNEEKKLALQKSGSWGFLPGVRAPQAARSGAGFQSQVTSWELQSTLVSGSLWVTVLKIPSYSQGSEVLEYFQCLLHSSQQSARIQILKSSFVHTLICPFKQMCA